MFGTPASRLSVSKERHPDMIRIYDIY